MIWQRHLVAELRTTWDQVRAATNVAVAELGVAAVIADSGEEFVEQTRDFVRDQRLTDAGEARVRELLAADHAG